MGNEIATCSGNGPILQFAAETDRIDAALLRVEIAVLPRPPPLQTKNGDAREEVRIAVQF